MIISPQLTGKRNTSKIRKHWKHSQLKDKENSFERTNNETDSFSLIDIEFKKEVMKILKKLRKTINRNANYCKKRTRNYKEEPRKIRKFICQNEGWAKPVNGRVNKAKERKISDLKDGIKPNKKKERNVRDLWGNIKHANLYII